MEKREGGSRKGSLGGAGSERPRTAAHWQRCTHQLLALLVFLGVQQVVAFGAKPAGQSVQDGAWAPAGGAADGRGGLPEEAMETRHDSIALE